MVDVLSKRCLEEDSHQIKYIKGIVLGVLYTNFLMLKSLEIIKLKKII